MTSVIVQHHGTVNKVDWTWCVEYAKTRLSTHAWQPTELTSNAWRKTWHVTSYYVSHVLTAFVYFSNISYNFLSTFRSTYIILFHNKFPVYYSDATEIEQVRIPHCKKRTRISVLPNITPTILSNLFMSHLFHVISLSEFQLCAATKLRWQNAEK